jgi:hypothetical protein
MRIGGITIERTPRKGYDSVDLDDWLQDHEVLNDVTNDGYIVGVGQQVQDLGHQMVERSKQLAAREDGSRLIGELGSTSPSPFTSWTRIEHNPKLRGKEGLREYDRMRRSDATVRGTLRLAKTPILAARWYMEPASESTRDQNVADFIWKNLTKWMSMSWPQFLTEALLMLDFGYYCFEKVFEFGDLVTSDPDAQGKMVWQKLAPRHPLDIISWHYDANGGPAYAMMMPPAMSITAEPVPIDIEKLLVFTFDKEAGDLEGMSLLRSAWKHYYYKENLYKIDAIQKERHGIGVPIITLPPNFNVSDRNLADQIGRNLRTNEKAHVVLPPNWTILFAKLEGQHVDALKSAEHHDLQIQKNILAAFLNGDTGNGDLPEAFLKSTRFIADIVIDIINKHAVPQLVDFNWSRVGYPQLKARRIGENTDWRTWSFALRNLIGAGVIQPDDRLEEHTRDEMDLPKKDESTVRVVATPQLRATGTATGDPNDPNLTGQPGQGGAGAGGTGGAGTGGVKPPRVGPPRQGPAAGGGGQMRPNAGRDGSGGK